MQIQAADYPLQVEPAQVLGFDCGLGAGLRICIFFGNKTQIGASVASLAPVFYACAPTRRMHHRRTHTP